MSIKYLSILYEKWVVVVKRWWWEILLNLFQIISGVIVVGLFGVLSVKKKAVDKTGLIAGFAVGLSVWILGGWQWFLIILVFHLIAAQFTKYKYELKRSKGAAEEKGGARAWYNVFANGGIAMLLAILEGYGKFGGDVFFAGFLGAISTATADTLATEIGLLNPGNPRLIVNLKKKVEPGTSGGITPLGEFATFAGALIIGLVAFLLQVAGFLDVNWGSKILFISVVAGFLGCTFDSILGATVQAVYRCQVCGKITEKRIHCGQKTKHIRGYELIENNTVNFISTALGALIAMLLYLNI